MSPVGTQFLYPPAVESYMPAFLASEPCRIYFSMTRFNNPADIHHVQLSLNYMNTNLSALNRDPVTGWPNGYKLCPITKNNSITTDHCYYITVSPSDLEGTDSEFKIQQYYKAQLRFCATPVTIADGDPGAPWYRTQMQEGKLSEWSTVCLIKGIPAPYVTIQGLKQGNKMFAGLYDSFGYTATQFETDVNPGVAGNQLATASDFDANLLGPIMMSETFYTGADTGYGSMVFSGQYSNGDTSEILDSYRALLFEVSALGIERQVSDTGILHPDSTYQNGDKYDFAGNIIHDYVFDKSIYNSFRYSFDTILKDGQSYRLDFSFITKSGYTETISYDFTTAFENIYFPNLTITPVTDYRNGRLGLNAASESQTNPGKIETVPEGVLLVKRSDHRSNFTSWKTIYERKVVNQPINETIYDYTAESGVFYKYAINDRDTYTTQTTTLDADGNIITGPKTYNGRPVLDENQDPVLADITVDDPIMVVYEDIFLIGADKQLKIKFNPQVSSFKYVVLDSKIDTLGGKYPFVIRNGNTKYKEMSISGLISAQSDELGLFVSEEELYGYASQEFQTYNKAQNINSQVDIIREREFRNKVLDFLYDGKTKLFKSTTEGNSLVRVTDVSLTPVDSLGRMLYSFSATLTEVAEYSIENLKDYGIELCGVTTDLIYMVAATVIAPANGFDTIVAQDWTNPVTINGDNPNISAYNKDLVYLYKRSEDTPPVPDSTVYYNFDIKTPSGMNNGWSDSIPVPDGRPLYAISAFVRSRINDVTISKPEWTLPKKFPMNIATLRLYQASVGVPAKPANNLTYKFAALQGIPATNYEALSPAMSATVYDSGAHYDTRNTVEQETDLTAAQFDRGVLDPASNGDIFGKGTFVGALGSWSTTIPSVPGGSSLYATTVTVFSNSDSFIVVPTSWSTPVIVTTTGSAINQHAKNQMVYLFQESDTGAPAAPVGNLTYTFGGSPAISTASLGNWSLSMPTTQTKPLYFIATSATGLSNATTTTLLPAAWTAPNFIGKMFPAYKDTVYLFSRQFGRTTPKAPNQELGYSFDTSTLTGYLGGWSRTNPLGAS